MDNLTTFFIGFILGSLITAYMSVSILYKNYKELKELIEEAKNDG